MMQPYTPHGDSNPPEWLALLLLAGCNLLPLALCRFLRRTCKVLAKTGALLRVAVCQMFCAGHSPLEHLDGGPNSGSAASAAGSASPTLPAAPSLFRPLDALAAAAPHGDNKKRPLGLCRLRGCFWVWGQGVSYRRKRVKANTLRLRVVPSG